MIVFENDCFLLRNAALSCLMRVNCYGKLELLHFGAPIELADAAALAPKMGLGWGSSVVLDDKDVTSCMDAMALAWSDAGRGDYREVPLSIAIDGAESATDFRYVSHRILNHTVPAVSGLPTARGEAETLEITMAFHRLRLVLYFTLFETALTRRAVLYNDGETPVTVRRLMSVCMDLPQELELTSFHGGWISEAHAERCAVGKAKVVIDSTTGASSNRHNAGFLLSETGAGENSGIVYSVNLIYSGNHYSSVQRSAQGLNRVVTGFAPFDKTLTAGKLLETPEAVLSWSAEGFNGLSQRMHDFVNCHIVPRAWQYRARPILYNSWEGCMFDFSERKLMSLAKQAKGLGCELFVLDDGWFGARNDDSAGLGDYAVNKKKLPHGIEGLADKVRALGMDFGLWFEPEAVNIDSDLYRAHPDWALRESDSPLLGRHELLLDLTRPEVRDYIVENVSAIIDRAQLRYVKWDMNRHSCALGAKAHEYVLGLYDVLRRIFTPRPEVLLEGCASGGDRFDLGMLCFAPQIWCSDDTDPVERLDIQNGLSYLYPLSTFGAHVSAAPHAQTLRTTPLSTRGNVSMFGVLGYELDLAHLTSVEEKEITAQIAFYREHRETFQFGTFTRLRAERGATAWQVLGKSETLVGLFHRLVHAAPPYEYLRVEALDSAKRYRVVSREQLLRVGAFGGLLKHVTPIALDPNGLIVHEADKRYVMRDAQEDCVASGAALMAGIALAARFAGTGYDKNLRVQGDFGSNIYVIEESEQA